MKRLGLVLLAASGALAAAPRAAHADIAEFKWATEGYFRTRTVLLTNLQPEDRTTFNHPDGEAVLPDIRRTSYIYSRARIMPTVSYGKLAKFQMQIDAFDDVLWGDNNGLASAPLFATDASTQGFLGGPVADSVKVSRAWIEFQVPVGIMRVGRMPSHWGMGLLANGGGTGLVDPTTPIGEPPRPVLDHFFPEDFGEKHFGSTTDRILFVTKPLSIYKTIKKAGDTTSNLIVGYAFDKLSEAPWLPLEPFERRHRPFGQQGFISRGTSDDVNEHVGLVLYNNPDWDPVRYTDELRVGVYGVVRTAAEGSTAPSQLDPSMTCGTFEGADVPCDDTGSLVYILDLWWKIRRGAWATEGEIYQIGGTTFGGVPFPGPNRKKEASINAGVVRAAYHDPTDTWNVVLEAGHASGDDALGDEKFTQRAMHPDFNVGLILFEETLREATARLYYKLANETSPNGALGFYSNGGVVNANYVNPRATMRLPIRSMTLTGGFLAAYVDKLATQGPALFFGCGNNGCQPGESNSKELGYEIDLSLKADFAGRMNFALETGYLFFGQALKTVLPNASGSFTLQTRLAFVW